MNVYEQTFRKYGFSLTQQRILEIVGQGKVILEVGSSSGYMTRAFLENDCIVDVVEIHPEAISNLPKKVRNIFNLSIEDNNIYNKLGRYDFVIMADVLEHLVNPEKVLKNLSKAVSFGTKLLVSLPNIASWILRKQLFFKGDFEYQESGILDKTHLHFYTVNSLPKILSANGWKINEVIGTITRLPLEGMVSKLPVMGWIFRKMFYRLLVEQYKNLAYYHFLVIASKK